MLMQLTEQQFEYECEMHEQTDLMDEIDYIPTVEEAEELISHAKTDEELRNMICFIWTITECDFDNANEHNKELMRDLKKWLYTHITVVED